MPRTGKIKPFIRPSRELFEVVETEAGVRGARYRYLCTLCLRRRRNKANKVPYNKSSYFTVCGRYAGHRPGWKNKKTLLWVHDRIRPDEGIKCMDCGWRNH